MQGQHITCCQLEVMIAGWPVLHIQAGYCIMAVFCPHSALCLSAHGCHCVYIGLLGSEEVGEANQGC